MKSIWILIIGCTPLAVLTASSFVDLAMVRRELPQLSSAEEPKAASLAAAAQAAQAQAEKPLVAVLRRSDLLAARPIPALQNPPAGSTLKALETTWPQWVSECEMVARFLDAQQTLATGHEDVKAAEQLEAWKTKYQALLPRQSAGLMEIADRQAGAIHARIARAALQARFNKLLSRARAALGAGQYAQCETLCNQLLSAEFKEVPDADTADKLAILRQRAQFREDLGALKAAPADTHNQQRRDELLRGFVKKYDAVQDASPSELETLSKLRRTLRDIDLKAAEAAQAREGVLAAAQLEESLPAGLVARLDQAAKIAQQFPAQSVRVRLQADIGRWLEEAFPEKQLREPRELQEAENRQGEILRGFFRPVKEPDGTLAGYQRYRTLAELEHPRSAVGTLPAQSLVSGPGESVPRLCVDRYNETRRALLAAPQQEEAWLRLSAACQEADRLMDAYRKKPDASREELSFGRESALCRQFAAAAHWPQLQAVFAP